MRHYFFNFFFSLVVFYSSCDAIACDVSSLKTLKDVYNAQLCIRNTQDELEKLLQAQGVVLGEIEKDLLVLMEHEVECIFIEKSRKYKYNLAIDKQMVNDCVKTSKEYAIKWSNAGAYMDKLLNNQKISEDYIVALKLKNNQLNILIKKLKDEK